MEDSGDVTALLVQLGGGDRSALDDLVPLIYDQLKAIAQNQLARESPGHSLNATALVHEAYLKIERLDRIEWQNRAHFFAIAAQAIRRVLVNHAIARNARKRGGGRVRVDLDTAPLFEDADIDSVLGLNQALERLEQLEPRQVRVVECRFFGAMNNEEIAEALGISRATVKRDWTVARAWLQRELSDVGESSGV